MNSSNEVESDIDIMNNVRYSNHYNEEDVYYFDFLNSIIHIIPLDQIKAISDNIVDRQYATYTCNEFKIINIELITYQNNDHDRFKYNMSYYRKNKSYDKFLKYDGPNSYYTFKSNESDVDKVYIFKSRERAFYNNMYGNKKISHIEPKRNYFIDGYKGDYKEWNDNGEIKNIKSCNNILQVKKTKGG